MFRDILKEINAAAASTGLEAASAFLADAINADGGFADTLRQIGIIPEEIAHDSTEEKLFAKASDAALSRAFRELGLKSIILKERADSADVLAESPIHGYSIAADAKAFRLSRTAKNRKDFKVAALSGWRQDADYAVLCAPYFQYPSRSSQIYAQALSCNVCLFSWEHFIFLIENGIKESESLSLAPLWGFCAEYSKEVLLSDIKSRFIEKFNASLLALVNLDEKRFLAHLNAQVAAIDERAKEEKAFWEAKIKKIEQYSREEAIAELIKSAKIYEKINRINAYLEGLKAK